MRFPRLPLCAAAAPAAARVAAFGLTALALVAGCSPHETLSPAPPPAPLPFRAQTSPGAVLYDITACYGRTDPQGIARYRALFDSTAYVFAYVDPQHDPNLTQRVGYGVETHAAANMLADPALAVLSLTFPLGDTSHATPSEATGDPPGTVLITIDGIGLEARRADTDYITHGSCDFYVAPFVSGSATEWRIVRWEDHTAPPAEPAPSAAGPSPVVPETWGTIKMVWR